jgi:hypothetical protein
VLLVCCLTLLGLCLSKFRAGLAGYVVMIENIDFRVTGGEEDLHYSTISVSCGVDIEARWGWIEVHSSKSFTGIITWYLVCC